MYENHRFGLNVRVGGRMWGGGVRGERPDCGQVDCLLTVVDLAIFFHRMYSLISLRESPPPQSYQLIVYDYYLEYQLNGFVGELTF